jgi:predicted transcriptional regulator
VIVKGLVLKDVSIGNVFKVLSDQKTEKLFKAIIKFNDAESQVLIVELGLSKKQYYDRVKNLLRAGIIRRKKGGYELSSFGKVIYSLYKIAEKASRIYWKLDAIDNIKTSENSHLAELDYMKIIDILLRDVEIKEFFLHGFEDLVKNKEIR